MLPNADTTHAGLQTAPDDTRMPPRVRRIVVGALAVLVAFAIYLFAVRGTAIVYDIGRLGAALLCL